MCRFHQSLCLELSANSDQIHLQFSDQCCFGFKTIWGKYRLSNTFYLGRVSQQFHEGKCTCAGVRECGGAPVLPFYTLWQPTSVLLWRTLATLCSSWPSPDPSPFMWTRPEIVAIPLRTKSQKLAPSYNGPFVIEHIFDPSVVRLKLPPSKRVHPNFHVSVL